MIRFLKRKLRNWVNSNELSAIKSSSESPSLARIDSFGINLRIYKAQGGTIIESNKYDKLKDRHNNSLYVITDDKDLGEEINKIITMESLR